MSKSYKECAGENAARKQARKYPPAEVVAKEPESVEEPEPEEVLETDPDPAEDE